MLCFLCDTVGRQVESKPWLSDPDLHLREEQFLWPNEFRKDGLKAYLQWVVKGMEWCKNMVGFEARFARVFATAAAQTALDETLFPKR